MARGAYGPTCDPELCGVVVNALANANIAVGLSDSDLNQIELDTYRACQDLLRALRIDVVNDHNTRGTAARMAKMFVRETFAGRYQPMPCLTDFPNVRSLDEVVIVGPVAVRSTCAHHFCPIEGQAWVGVIPGDVIIGLSKFARVTEWIMARPQVQEEATVQLADVIEKAIKPQALGVIVTAKHSCMTWRGVREPAAMATTSVMRGLFRTQPEARAEFLKLMGQLR